MLNASLTNLLSHHTNLTWAEHSCDAHLSTKCKPFLFVKISFNFCSRVNPNCYKEIQSLAQYLRYLSKPKCTRFAAGIQFSIVCFLKMMPTLLSGSGVRDGAEKDYQGDCGLSAWRRGMDDNIIIQWQVISQNGEQIARSWLWWFWSKLKCCGRTIMISS